MKLATVGRLCGKVALDTVASSGLGEAIAFQFAREGAWVFAPDVEFDSAERVINRIGIKAHGWEEIQSSDRGVRLSIRHGRSLRLKFLKATF